MRRIAEALVHPALARGDGDSWLAPQPVERNADLAPVAGAYAVGNDVGEVAGIAQVEGGLGDADVRFDAYEGDARSGGEFGGDGGDEHGELGLIVGSRREEGGDGRDGGAELGRGLGGCVDGDGQELGVGEELDGGGDAVRFWFVSRWVVMPRGLVLTGVGGEARLTCCRIRR